MIHLVDREQTPRRVPGQAFAVWRNGGNAEVSRDLLFSVPRPKPPKILPTKRFCRVSSSSRSPALSLLPPLSALATHSQPRRYRLVVRAIAISQGNNRPALTGEWIEFTAGKRSLTSGLNWCSIHVDDDEGDEGDAGTRNGEATRADRIIDVATTPPFDRVSACLETRPLPYLARPDVSPTFSAKYQIEDLQISSAASARGPGRIGRSFLLAKSHEMARIEN